jgi:hypothetical protein
MLRFLRRVNMKKFFGVVLVLIVMSTWGVTAFAGQDYVATTELTVQITSIGSELCSVPGPWPVPDID